MELVIHGKVGTWPAGIYALRERFTLPAQGDLIECRPANYPDDTDSRFSSGRQHWATCLVNAVEEYSPGHPFFRMELV